jgi:hypothetical protein
LFSNSGNFIHGGASTIIWTTTNNNAISMNGDTFYNLVLNSGGDGSGNAVFSTESALTIEGAFHLIAGTLNISDAAHTVTVGGDFNNESTINSGSAKFIFNGSTVQTLTASATQNFNNLELSGAGSKVLAVDIIILGSLTNNSVFNAGTHNISCKGDWGGTGSLIPGTSTVTLDGSTSQRVTKAVTFNNLIINNSSVLNSVSLNGIITINGNLTLTDGVVTTSTSKYIYLINGATLTGGNENSYISGLLRKAGSEDFIFPIGTSSYYAPLQISNLGSVADFSAQYFDVAPTNRSLLEEGLNSVSDAEYWNLTRNSGTASPIVSLYWNDSDFSGINDVDVLSVARYNTLVPQWQSYGVGSVTPSADTTSGFITSDLAFDAFGKITFGYEYPTLVWDSSTGSTNFTDPANWIGGSSQAPSAQTNIQVPDVTGGDHPIVSIAGQSTYNVLVQNGGILEIADNMELKVEGIFDVEAGGTLILGANASLTLYQDFTVNGTIQNNTNSTLKFSGIVDQNITFDTCYNAVFNGSALKILNSDIVVKGNVSITNSLNPGSHTLTVMGNWVNSGTFNSATSTVILKGTSTQALSESSANGFYNLTINNTSPTIPQITLNTNVLVSGALNMLDGVISSTTTREFRVGNTGTLVASSDSAYVDGSMYKYGVADFVFPIGKNSIVAKLGISGMSGSGNFRAEYFDTKYADLENIGVGLDKVTNIEYWNLSRPSGTAKPYITLYWSDSVRSGVADHTGLRVAHYYSDSWHDIGNGSSAAYVDSSGYVRSSLTVDSFSPFTLASVDGSNPLPIELEVFAANVIDNNVVITWTTATEKNNHFFSVERMNSVGEIEKLVEISGAGNSNEALSYKVFDYNPFMGDSYYRLKQTDFDGKTITYDWLAVNYWPKTQKSQFELEVYPNPSNGEQVNLQVSGIQSGQITCNVYNLMGELVNTESLTVYEGTLSQVWSLSLLKGLNQGIYLLKVSDGVSEQLQRIIIK